MLVRLFSVSFPLIAFVPDHAPLAVQEVASVLDQVSVDEPPDVTVGGLADKVTVGETAHTVGFGPRFWQLTLS